MVELSEETGFSLETIQPLFVSRKLLGEDFDGNVSSELRVARAVDLSHTSFGDRR